MSFRLVTMIFLRKLIIFVLSCALILQTTICEKSDKANATTQEDNATRRLVARSSYFKFDDDGYDTVIEASPPVEPIVQTITYDPYRTESAEFHGVNCSTSPQNRIVAVGSCKNHFFLCWKGVPQKISCFDLIKISRPNDFDVYTDFVFNWRERRCEKKESCIVQKGEENVAMKGLKLDLRPGTEMWCDEGNRFPMSDCSNRYTICIGRNFILRTCVNGTIFDPESKMCSCNVKRCRYAHWALGTHCPMLKEPDSTVYTPVQEPAQSTTSSTSAPIISEASFETNFAGQKLDPSNTNLIILPLGEGPNGMKRGLCGYIVPCHYKQDSKGIIIKTLPPMTTTTPSTTTTTTTTEAPSTTATTTTTVMQSPITLPLPCVPKTTTTTTTTTPNQTPNVKPNCTYFQPIIYTNLKSMNENDGSSQIETNQWPGVGAENGKYFLDEFNTRGLRMPRKRYINPFNVIKFHKEPIDGYINPVVVESDLRVPTKK